MRKQSFNTINAFQLMEENFGKSMSWAVEEIMPAGLTILAGQPKVGKSWMALSLAMAVANGQLALGKYPTVQGDVLYLNYESKGLQLSQRMEKLLGDNECPQNLAFPKGEIPTQEQGALCCIEGWIEDRPNPRLVVIDTMQLFFGVQKKKGNAYELDYEKLRPLKKLSDKHDLTILLVHHLNKRKTRDPFEAINGSNGITGAVDTMWVLQREWGGLNTTLAITARDTGRKELILSDQGTMDWVVLYENDAERVSPERQAIIDLLSSHPETLDSKDISERLGKNSSTTRSLLAKMADAGQITRSSTGRYTIFKVEP